MLPEAPQENGHSEAVTQGELPFGVKKCGWLFRFIQEGWLKKRWRKRWCILKHEVLYIYEHETFDDTDEPKCTVKLDQYQTCDVATKKESKKPFTFVLMPEKRRAVKNKKDTKKKVNKELIYALDENEMKSWIAVISETIAFTQMDEAEKAKALAPQRVKANLKPKGKKPPTRQHRRKVAALSQASMDMDTLLTESSPPPEPKKRAGNRPKAALVPNKSRKISGSTSSHLEDNGASTDMDVPTKSSDTSEENKDVDTGGATPSPKEDTLTESVPASADNPMETDEVDENAKSAADSLSESLENTLNLNDESMTKVDEDSVFSEKDSSTVDKTDEVNNCEDECESETTCFPLEPVGVKELASAASAVMLVHASAVMETDTAGNTNENCKNENSNSNSGLIVEILEDHGFIRTEL